MSAISSHHAFSYQASLKFLKLGSLVYKFLGPASLEAIRYITDSAIITLSFSSGMSACVRRKQAHNSLPLSACLHVLDVPWQLLSHVCLDALTLSDT